MGKKKKKDSPAIHLLDHVWHHDGGRARVKSWERLNHSMHGALSLAITSIMDFDLDDFSVIAERYRPGHWMGETYGERYYSIACCGVEHVTTYGLNMSACLAFEHWKKRKPFLVVRSSSPRDAKIRDRICIGKRFYWEGHYVKCTSFASDGESFTACSYKSRPSGGYHGRAKIDRRFTITHDKIAEYHAAIRELDKAEKKRKVKR